MNFQNKYPHDLCQKIARPGITLTFVNAMSPVTMQDASDSMLSNGTKKSGISPARIIGKYGMNVNFSINTENRHEGADGSIEESKLSYMLQLTNECIRMQLASDAEEAVDEMPDVLKTEIKYVTNAMRSSRGMSAIEIVLKYPLQEIINAIMNIKTSPYPARNEPQMLALQFALFTVYGRKLSLDGRTSLRDDYLSGQIASKVSMGQDKNTVLIAGLMIKEKDTATLQACLNYTPAKSASKQIEIYKAFKTPNPRKVDVNGNTDGYQLSITCNPSKKTAPVHVELITMKGKPLANRIVGMNIDKNIPPKVFAMDIEMCEWYDAISSAVEYKNAMKCAYIKNARNMELVLDYINRHPGEQPTQEIATRYQSILNFI